VQNWTKKFAKVAKVTKGCKMRCIFPDAAHSALPQVTILLGPFPLNMKVLGTGW